MRTIITPTIQQPASPLEESTTTSGDALGLLGGQVNRATIADLLYQVIDPEIGVNIVDLGLVFGIAVANGQVAITMTLTTPGCPLAGYIEDCIHRALWGLPSVDNITVDIVWDPAWGPELMSDQAKIELGWMS
jgi:metal-sulfur cluster biosynthetic enzyme